MKSHIETKACVLLAAIALMAVLGAVLGANAQNQIVLNDHVYVNGVPGTTNDVVASTAVSGQFDCTVYDANDTTNCHTLVVGFRDGNKLWVGGEPVVVLQATTANPAGQTFNNVTFAVIQAPPSPGTYFLWVDDVLGSPTCASAEAAINAFKTSQPSGEDALLKILATVTTSCPRPDAPSTLAPACSGTVATITPTLAWSTVPDASGYIVVISTGASCLEAQVFADTVATTSLEVPSTAGLQYGQTYSWRVYALSSCGGRGGPGSPCCSFTVVPPLLSISLAGTNMVISWPTSIISGLVLVSTNALGPGNWPPVGTSPVVSNGCFQVTIPPTGSAGFYRLEK